MSFSNLVPKKKKKKKRKIGALKTPEFNTKSTFSLIALNFLIFNIRILIYIIMGEFHLQADCVCIMWFGLCSPFGFFPTIGDR